MSENAYFFGTASTKQLPRIQLLSRSQDKQYSQTLQTESNEQKLFINRNVYLKQLEEIICSIKINHLSLLIQQMDVHPCDFSFQKLYASFTKCLTLVIKEINVKFQSIYSTIESLKQNFYHHISIRDTINQNTSKQQHLETINSKLSDTVKIKNNKQSTKNFTQEQEDGRIKYNRVILENANLSLQVNQLSDKFLHNDKDYQTLVTGKSSLEIELNLLKIDYERLKREKDVMQRRSKNQIDNSNQNTKLIENEIKECRTLNTQLNEEYAILQLQTAQLNQKFIVLRETNQMMLEDMEMQKFNFQSQKDLNFFSTKKPEKPVKEMFKIYQQFLIKRLPDRWTVLEVPNATDYAEQTLTKIRVSNYYKNEPCYKNIRVDVKIGSKTPQTQSQEEEEIKSANFQFNLPPFMIFLDSHIEAFENQMHVSQYRTLDATFFLLFRQVMDCYWNEILISDDLRLVPRFADFVYHWFQYFSLDKKSYQIIQIENASDTPFMEFMLDVYSSQLSKIWEVSQFKALMQDQMTRDQEYFFFYARQIVFRGLCTQRDNPTATIQLIPIIHADMVIELFLQKYTTVTILQSKQGIRQFLKTVNCLKGDIQVVDAWFVVCLIMEFYEIERKQMYSYIQQQFARAQGLQKPSKNGVSFNTFQKIMRKTFPDIPVVTICQFYREAFALGIYGVTPENFMVIATENQFLTINLSIYRNSHFIPVQKSQLISNTSEESKQFQLYLKGMQQNFEGKDQFSHEQLVQIGSIGILNDYKKFNRLLNMDFNEFQSISLNFEMQNIINKINKVKILKIFHQCLYDRQEITMKFGHYIDTHVKPGDISIHHKRNNVQISKKYGTPAISQFQELQSQINQFLKLIESFEVFKDQSQKILTEKNTRVKQIQMAHRQKTTQFYEFMKVILSLKLKQTNMRNKRNQKQ